MVAYICSATADIHNAPTNPAEGAAPPLAPEPGAAQEAPPLAPEPAEIPRAELLNKIHDLLRERVREQCERGKGRLSAHFPDMPSIYSQIAENIVRDLEISEEMDVDTLRGWVREMRENPNLLKSLIRGRLPD